jgi:zinc transport system permease protein
MITNIFPFLQYTFMQRGLEAGILIAIIAPLIGIFLVIRRYALIADTLSHVSLTGVALGVLLKINPLITAIMTSIGASIIIEQLRIRKKVTGDSALSLFLSGSLALALILLSLANGFSVNLFSYLFGSILTVTNSDVFLIGTMCIIVLVLVGSLFKELVTLSFDEELAQASGIPTRLLNMLFIILSAVTVAIAIPVVGILLISALLVIPTLTALQFKKSFFQTVLIAEVVSISAVISGVILSYYLNLSAGGTIVLLMLGIFVLTLVLRDNG